MEEVIAAAGKGEAGWVPDDQLDDDGEVLTVLIAPDGAVSRRHRRPKMTVKQTEKRRRVRG